VTGGGRSIRPGRSSQEEASFEANQGDPVTDKTDKRVWFITGAGRGMGVDFAKAATPTAPQSR